MKKEVKFPYKLKNFNLYEPDSKREYNDKLFSVVAYRYDMITRILSFNQDKSWKKKLLTLIKPVIKPNCLDLACGTGDVTTALANKFPYGAVTGLDLNDTMLELATKSTDQTNVQFVKGDMSNLSFSKNSFDLVTGSYALRNAPNLLDTLMEIKRVMKPGGQALFLDFSKPVNKFAAGIQSGLLRLWGNIWGFLMHGNHEVYGYIAQSLSQFPNRDQFKNILLESGFVNIRFKKLFGGFIDLVSIEKSE